MSKHIVGDLEIRSLEVKDAGGVIRELITSEGFKQVRYRDEYVGGVWGEGTGQASPSYSNFTIGDLVTRRMTLDNNDAISNVFEVPHDMLYSTDPALQPELHIHFRPTTDDVGTVKFFLLAEWSKANSSGFTGDVVVPVSLTSGEGLEELVAEFEIPEGQGSALYPHMLKAFTPLLPVNTYRIGDLIGFRCERRTGQGTYTAAVIVEKVAMHVPIDDRGSRQLYIK